MATDLKFGFGTPFYEQLEFFRKKLNLPTQRWDDIKKSAHDRAFIVAGAEKADLLHDLHRAIDKAIAQGLGIEEFRRDFKQIVFNHGWTGWTGQGSKSGEAWRTSIIYQTNMATSYAAGRWRQLTDPELLKERPYWQYRHADGVMHPRPMHLSWNGITLPYDHIFWKTHFAPNGWKCHCRIIAVGRSEYENARLAGKAVPPDGWDTIDPKTGAQIGIDKGFDYAPGASSDIALRQMVQDKLITYPPAITKVLTRDVNRYINAEQIADRFVREVIADVSRTDSLWLGFVENYDRIAAETDSVVNAAGYFVLLPADAPRHVESSHGFDGGTQRPPVPEDYNQLMSILTDADSIRLGDTSIRGSQRIVVIKQIGDEVFRCVFEVREGKRNRALSLISFVIKI